MPDFSDILHVLPDTHRWVEARALLLSGTCDVFGWNGSPSLVVRDADRQTLFVIGAPEPGIVMSAIRNSPGASELIVAQEHVVSVAGALRDWSRTTIRMFALRDDRRLPDPAEGAVGLLDPEVLARLSLDAELKEELDDGAAVSAIAASFVDGQPVAFCYAGATTETLWDVAIDTVEAHRRQGHAGRCAAFMIRRMRTFGKEPVWQAAEDNPSSWRLAAKLGFEVIAELTWFRRDE